MAVMMVILESGQKVERREHMKSGIGPTEINSKVVSTDDRSDRRQQGRVQSVRSVFSGEIFCAQSFPNIRQPLSYIRYINTDGYFCV